MREAEFRSWLQAQGYAANSMATYLSDARKVDQAYDLDLQFERDGGATMLAEMAYSRADEAAGRPNPSRLDYTNSFYRNLAACRASARAYFRFLASEARPQGRFGELSRQAVFDAMAACDAAGSVAQYVADLGLGQPTKYWLVIDGKRYPSKAVTRDALMRCGSEWEPGGAECKEALERLGFVVVDWPELSRARDSFLRQMPDFGDFQTTQGAYWDIERNYKNGLITKIRGIVAEAGDDRSIGQRIYRSLAGSQAGSPLSWRTLSEIQNADPALRDRFYAEIGTLARSEAPLEEAIATAARALEALRAEGIAILRRGEVLSIPITVWATIHPDQASWFKVAKIEEMGQRFFGRRLFRGNDFREEDLAEWLQLMRALFGLLDKEFGWKPQDLFDVQGFIWVVGQDKREDEVSNMENEEILAKFDVDLRFKTAREAWSEDETAAFCDIARAIHDVGLDWFVVRGPGNSFLRFGIRNQSTVNAEGVIGFVNPAQNEIYLNDRYGITPRIKGAFSAININAMLEAIRPAHRHFANWTKLPLGRRAYWPVDYSGPAGAELEREDVTPSEPTNLILYGPPGTGKTYRTAQEAVRLCGEAVPEDRDELMQRYEKLSEEGRIRFVTFHQSFSYEEFVEGLRPSTGGNDAAAGGEGTASGFELKVHDGIFKRIANDAAADTGGVEAADLLDQAKPVIRLGLPQGSRNETFERFTSEGFIGWPHGGDYDWSAPEFEDWEAIKERRKRDEPELLGNNIKIYGTWLFRSSEPGTYVMLTSGWGKVHALGRIDGDYEYHPQAGDDWARHRRRVEWLWDNAEGVPRETLYPNSFTTFHAAYALDKQLINWDALNRLVFGDDAVVKAAASRRPYVLIIDEINRANVSKVFGELITLIEPDKRLGKDNRLKVTLPYSGHEFGVPANLHIIGTMNTADRSIALLDTALRRRFRFEEIAPEPELLGKVDGIDLAAVLTAMNRRIEYLVDRDHRIGHAFFIDCKTKADVDAVMRDKVIPLLQEYFFDDWNRLAAVLGEKKDKGGNFLDCERLHDPMGEGRDPINSWRVRPSFDEGAYDRLIAGASAQPSQAEDEV